LILTVMKQKMELEQQIRTLGLERNRLVKDLDISSDTIHKLEKRHRDQEMLMRVSQQDLEELRTGNLQLLETLESKSRSMSSANGGCVDSHTSSLHSELEMFSEREKSLYSRNNSFNMILEMEEEEDEFDNYELDPLDPLEPLTEPMALNMTDDNIDSVMTELSDEVFSTYQQLKNMCQILKKREIRAKISIDSIGILTSTISSSSSGYGSDLQSIPTIQVGQLEQVVTELRSLLQDVILNHDNTYDTPGCGTCGRNVEEKLELERETHQTLEMIERGNIGLKKANLEAKKMEEQIQGIKSKLALVSARLSAAEEERNILKSDMEEVNMSRDIRIKNAWTTRDSAVTRKNEAEVDLAKCRIEMMQVNSQLLEAVQQKVKLSEQLDDWEVDLQRVVEDQVKDRLVKESRTGKNNKSNKRIIKFFYRS